MVDIKKQLKNEFDTGLRFFQKWGWALTAHLDRKDRIPYPKKKK